MKDLLKVLSDIADAVQKAVDLIPSLGERGEYIGMGADGTPTSEIDKIAENTVLDYIVRHKVPLNVLSEEIGFVDYGYSETLVLDPVDGSTNAAAGVPLFTISMGVGKGSLAGIRTAYLRNLTTGESMWAEKGKGAFKDGKRISVRKADMKRLLMMIYMGNGSSRRAYDLAKRVKSVRDYGCASIEMQLIAEGQADGFYLEAERYPRGIRVVDIAASYLILKEAGGEIFDLSGKELDMPLNLEARSSFLAVGDPSLYKFVMGKDNKIQSSPVYALTVNPNSPGVKELAQSVVKAMEGEKLILDESAGKVLRRKGTPLQDIPADVVISIGGDGTILRAAQRTDAAIVGINNGGVGFLTDIPSDAIEDGIARLRRGEYAVAERFKIDTYLNGTRLEPAVNEAVIHTDSVAKIRQFRIYVDGHLASEVRADGIIVSSPIGSTSYAMSLGAPMMEPGVEAFIIVPMAAYKFSSRPFIVPSDSKVTVECVNANRGCLVVIDGQSEHQAPGGSVVECVRSPQKLRIVDFGKDFYSRVREKMVNVI